MVNAPSLTNSAQRASDIVGSEPDFAADRCDLCGAVDTAAVLDWPAPSMTSDGRMIDQPLHKVRCTGCGLVRNGRAMPQGFLTSHYADAYRLGFRADRAEPHWLGVNGPVARSALACDWITTAVSNLARPAPRRILEIGCGEGLLLKRMATAFPHAKVQGIEPNRAGAMLGRRRGLDIGSSDHRYMTGTYDLIYSVAVIEHVPSPRSFLESLGAGLNPGGLLVVVHPTQERPNHDIFMVDHLFHFHASHVDALATSGGLKLVEAGLGEAMFFGFALQVFENAEAPRPRTMAFTETPEIDRAIGRWTAIFRDLDEWLYGCASQRPIIWGIGETFHLLCAYTKLSDIPFAVALDDVAGGSQIDGISIIPSANVSDEMLGAHPVLLTFKPNDAVRRRLARACAHWFSPFEMEPCGSQNE